MIARRIYSMEEGKDTKIIWDKPFLRRLEESEDIKVIQYARGSSPYILHVHPGLTVTIQDDEYPVIAYGSSLISGQFERGVSILEELMQSKLTLEQR